MRYLRYASVFHTIFVLQMYLPRGPCDYMNIFYRCLYHRLSFHIIFLIHNFFHRIFVLHNYLPNGLCATQLSSIRPLCYTTIFHVVFVLHNYLPYDLCATQLSSIRSLCCKIISHATFGPHKYLPCGPFAV